ncbi:N-acetyllactosaminide 3-alpha-galactosyltransferase [Paragonimus heterotremus]|uniref:Beta-1,4-galactosyltransferase n=1 Tax=Paragonimus heterotremus TaxID=100268 RepID=A0A8J4SYA1_9TREM|nr:N-acetyllactosaminide 3-alpha-galactosyltransferase [Paragonimus heterotremus]
MRVVHSIQSHFQWGRSDHRMKICLATGLLLLTYLWYLSNRHQKIIVTDPSTIIPAECWDDGGKFSHKSAVSDLRKKDRDSGVRTCCPNREPLAYSRWTAERTEPTYGELFEKHADLCHGNWAPTSCVPSQFVAVIVPFKDREHQLRFLLDRLHATLKHQRIAYGIYVIEQVGNKPFNRGLLLNIGVREALRQQPNTDCFIFHDVDLLPENSANVYMCDQHLRQLSSGIDEFRFHPPFSNNAGGVSALSKDTLFKLNGFPNRYWGWGNEDDELSARRLVHKLHLSRPPSHIGRYQAIRHIKSNRGKGHYASFLQFRGFQNDGLSSLNKSSYLVLSNISYQLPVSTLSQNKKIGIPTSWSICAVRTFAENLGIPANSLQLEKTGSRLMFSHGYSDVFEQTARSMLYKHILIDPSPIYNVPVRPSQDTRESWFWFLHFYGWI